MEEALCGAADWLTLVLSTKGGAATVSVALVETRIVDVEEDSRPVWKGPTFASECTSEGKIWT